MMDKCDAQFRPQIYQRKRKGQNRCNYTKMTTRQGIDNLVETKTHHIDVEEDLVRIIHKIIE